MLVENIMKTPVVTITPEMSIYDALQTLHQHKIRHLPVVDVEGLVGILSDRDLRDACPSSLTEGDLSVIQNSPVSQIMSSPVLTVHPLDFFDEAARMMYEKKVGCLPVVSNRQVVGIISETDILRHLVEMMGVMAPGTYLEVDVPDKPGALAEVTQIIKEHGVNVTSVLLCPTKENGRKCLILRIQTINISKILREIEAAGYQILWPVATGG
ncbi:MAG TPA: CBS and ACT domain-containing protein [Candidatus Deferrimicrobium sp.]|nr:CBS and ACT domain-containing protein [Candidatus Deferrimicrobium sp.]